LERTRILLVDVSPLLKEILLGEEEEEGFVVVGELGRTDDLGQAIEDTSADLIVCSDGKEPDVRWRSILDERARLRVLTLAHRGRATALHELHPRDSFLGEISATEFREILRGARPRAGTCEEKL